MSFPAPSGPPTPFQEESVARARASARWNHAWLENARRSLGPRVLLALVCAAGGALLLHFFTPDFEADHGVFYLLLVLFAAVSAGFGGAIPGLLTLGALMVLVAVRLPDEARNSDFWLFAGVGFLFCLLCGGLNAARGEAQEFALQSQKAKARLQNVFETTTEGVWMLDTQFQTQYANVRMAQLLGTSPEKMLKRPVSDWLFDEDKPILENYKSSIPTGQAHEATRRYKREDGTELWCLVSASPMFDEDGTWSGALAMHSDITDSRAQEVQRARMNERYQVALDSLGGYLYEVDVATQHVYRSPNFYQVLGFSENEVEPTVSWWRTRVHPDFQSPDEDYWELICSIAGDHFSAEYPVQRKEGVWIWIWERGTIFRNENGEPVRVVGAVTDITARREVEEHLRQSEEKFRQLSDLVPHFVYSNRPDGTPEFYNERWYEYTGMPRGEVDPNFWFSAMHPDDRDSVLAAWSQAVTSGNLYAHEGRIRGADGKYRYFMGRSVPVRGADGEILRWIGTSTDIDDRKREEKRAALLARVGKILGSSLDLDATLSQLALALVPDYGDWAFVYLRGEDGMLHLRGLGHVSPICVQSAWGEIGDLATISPNAKAGPGAVFQTGETEFIPEISDEFWEKMARDETELERMRQNQVVSGVSVPLCVGERVLGVLSLSYCADATGTSGRFIEADVPLIEEVARRAAIALDNARLYGELKEADARKDEFLAMLAHELRNPLAAIRGAQELLNEQLTADSSTQTQLSRLILERQSAHLARLVDDLLDVSRITRGKIELRQTLLDWREIASDAASAATPLALARGHELQADLGEKPIWIEADRARALQIAANLLSNAIKYTAQGGQIRIWLEAGESEATLCVRDNGPGLSPATQERIWNLFEQESRTLDRAEGGLGIGLTLVKSLAQLHGGRVSVESKEGQGSTFFVTLPRVAAPENTDEPAPATEEKPSAQVVKVLVVDDNPDAALMLKLWLEKRGFQAQMAVSGVQGLEIARDFQPNFALLDVGMPSMNGYELAQKMRQQHGDEIQLFALTGYGQESDRARSFEAGFNQHLTKPVEFETLLRLLGKV